MAVSFNNIAANWRVPLFWAEVDSSRAGNPVLDQRAILLGQKLAAGSAAADVPVPVSSLTQAKALFGTGSMLARMVEKFLAGNTASELWAVPLAEPGAGVAATGSILVTGPATAAGTISLYVAGQIIAIPVASADSANTIAAAINSAINAAADLPVTSTVSTATVTVLSKWKGATGNDITLQHSYGGVLAGEALPTGTGLTITAMSGGTSAPSLATAIANLGDEPYEHVAFPFTDSTSLNAIRDQYGFGDSGRWGWMRQLYGHVWSAIRGTQGALTTFGNARNDGVISVLGVETSSPTPPWEWAAAYTAKAARALLNDPARPLQTLTLDGVLPARHESRFTLTERNTLLYDGVATQFVDKSGTVHIDRAVTTYQANSFGQPDDAFLDATTLATLAAVLREMKGRITSKFPRHKLANDGTRFGQGQAIVTPKVIKAELVAHYRSLEERGLVENADAFKAALIVERSITDPTRVDVLYPPDLVNPLVIFAVVAQFRLQYDRFANEVV